MIEEWKTLKYRNIEYVNYEINIYGKIRNKETKHILSIYEYKVNESKNRTPYLGSSIGLGKRGKSKLIILHRAVAETYLENPNNYKFVKYKDGDYKNINIDNLYWSEHVSNKYKNGEKRKRISISNCDAVNKRRRKLKELSVDYKGGKCIICKYDKYFGALEFHHLDPNEKDFSISKSGTTRSWEKLKQELDKCICVCANCHREIHAGLIDLNNQLIVA